MDVFECFCTGIVSRENICLSIYTSIEHTYIGCLDLAVGEHEYFGEILGAFVSVNRMLLGHHF